MDFSTPKKVSMLILLSQLYISRWDVILQIILGQVSDLQIRFTDKWKNTQIRVKEIINVTKNRTKFSTTVQRIKCV